MVVGVLANIFTSFGIGELSGAGFGPNYTILMKLGFEYFAPRILDEMDKADGEFAKTPHWQQWQRQMKLYSDEVMQDTLNKLLQVPQATLDALEAKFGAYLGGLTTPTSGERTITGVPTNVRLDLGQGTRRDEDRENRDRSDDAISPFERDVQRETQRQATTTNAKNWTELRSALLRERPAVTGPDAKTKAIPKRRKSQSSNLQILNGLETITRLSKQAQTIFQYEKFSTHRSAYIKLYFQIWAAQQGVINLQYLYI